MDNHLTPGEEAALKRLHLQSLRAEAERRGGRGSRIAAWIIGPILVIVVVLFFIGAGLNLAQ